MLPRFRDKADNDNLLEAAHALPFRPLGVFVFRVYISISFSPAAQVLRTMFKSERQATLEESLWLLGRSGVTGARFGPFREGPCLSLTLGSVHPGTRYSWAGY